MTVAVLGGTGFLGYDFVRSVVDAGEEVVVYSSSASNLTNIKRFDLDVRFAPYDALDSLTVDSSVRLLVNFAHPFGARDGLSVRHQARLLARFLVRQLQEREDLRLIHVSTMSVYEPFGQGLFFDERHDTRPPKADAYASTKYEIDSVLQRSSVSERAILLRPTVVYGPFCRPWTDNLMMAFRDGKVFHRGLSGRIQPIFVKDVSRFLLSFVQGIDQVRGGIYNLPGPEIVTWYDLFAFFQRVVGRGELVDVAGDAASQTTLDVMRSTARELLGNKRVKDAVATVLSRMPTAVETTVRTRHASRNYAGLRKEVDVPSGPYCASFFEQDRLVSAERLRERFGDIPLTAPNETYDIMRRYHEYRFGGEPIR